MLFHKSHRYQTFLSIHLADVIGKELVPNPLNLAAELQVSQIPPETFKIIQQSQVGSLRLTHPPLQT